MLGMVHHRERLALGLEAGDDLPAVHAGLEDLEGDAALDRLALFGHPDFAEAAFADLLQQLVAADHLRGGLRRGRGHGGGLREARDGSQGRQESGGPEMGLRGAPPQRRAGLDCPGTRG
jgi:hypothetical protein